MVQENFLFPDERSRSERDDEVSIVPCCRVQVGLRLGSHLLWRILGKLATFIELGLFPYSGSLLGYLNQILAVAKRGNGAYPRR